MLIIDSKDCENIDKALKKYKKKFEKAKISGAVKRAPVLYQAICKTPWRNPEGSLQAESEQRTVRRLIVKRNYILIAVK